MAEDTRRILSTILKVAAGLALLVFGVMAVIRWFESLKTVFTGCIGLFLILTGIITLAIAKE